MAVDLDGTSDYLISPDALYGKKEGVAIVCWYYPDLENETNGGFMGFGSGEYAEWDREGLRMYTNPTGNLRWTVNEDRYTYGLGSAHNYDAGNWYIIALSNTSSNNQWEGWYGKYGSSTVTSIGTLTRFRGTHAAGRPIFFGSRGPSTTALVDGKIARAAYWEDDDDTFDMLDIDDVNALFFGAPPTAVKSKYLKSWFEFDNPNQLGVDRLGWSNPLTENGSPAWYPDPPHLIKPGRPYIIRTPASAGHTSTAALSFNVLSMAGTGVQDHQATGALTVGGNTYSGTGSHDHEGTAAMTLGPLTYSATGSHDHEGTGAMTVGGLTYAGTGVQDHQATATMTLGALTYLGSAVMGFQGSGAMTLGTITYNATGSHDHEGTAAMTVGGTTMNATGSHDHEGTAALNIGALTYNASGARTDIGTGTVSYDKLSMSATGSGTTPDGSGAIVFTKLSIGSEAQGGITYYTISPITTLTTSLVSEFIIEGEA